MVGTADRMEMLEENGGITSMSSRHVPHGWSCRAFSSCPFGEFERRTWRLRRRGGSGRHEQNAAFHSASLLTQGNGTDLSSLASCRCRILHRWKEIGVLRGTRNSWRACSHRRTFLPALLPYLVSQIASNCSTSFQRKDPRSPLMGPAGHFSTKLLPDRLPSQRSTQANPHRGVS